LKLKKLNNLQAGRGIAALDFFFVLSGFIIAYTSISFFGQKNGAILFLKKRFIRIYPIYWVYLLVAVIFGFIQYRDPHIFDHFLNIVLLLPGHHFLIYTSWTLPFELVFYLLFCLLIFSRWSLFVIIPFAIISITNAVLQNFGTYGIFNDHALNDLFTCFNVEFLLGYLAYLVYDKINKPMIYGLIVMVCIAMVLEILYFKRADYGEIYPGQRVLPFGLLAFAAVTAFAALDHKDMFRAPKFLVNLGDASYTLYLIHANIFGFAQDAIFMRYKFSEQTVMILMEFVVAFTIYISFVLYKYLERPLINRISKLMSVRKVIVSSTL